MNREAYELLQDAMLAGQRGWHWLASTKARRASEILRKCADEAQDEHADMSIYEVPAYMRRQAD